MKSKRSALCLLVALALACGACSNGAPEEVSAAIAPLAQERTAAPAPEEESPFWSAVAALDLAAAREAAAGDEERRFAAALESALRGGSTEAGDELCALGSGAKDARVRRWSGQSLLNLLRLEGRWKELVALREGCPGLRLSEKALPTAMVGLPEVSVSVPEEPAVLPLLDSELRLAVVAARVRGSKASRELPALIDTGSNMCILGSDLAESLGVRMLEESKVINSSGELVGRPRACSRRWPSAALSRATSPPSCSTPRPCGRSPATRRSSSAGEILQRMAFEIAGGPRELVLRRSVPEELGEARVGAPDAAGDHNLVLLREPAVRLRSGEVPLLFLLDTGNNGTEATPRLVQRLGAGELPTHADTVRALGGEKEVQAPYFERLPLTIGDLPITVGNVSVMEVPRHPHEFLDFDGTLGVDAGLAARLVVDAPNRRLELRAR